MASIRPYKTSVGERRYEVRWRDARGRHKSRVFRLRADAERYRADVDRRKLLGTLYEAPPQVFGDFLDGWLTRYQRRVRASTYERSAQTLRHLHFFARSRVPEIRAADVEDLIARVAANAPRQAQIALALLKQVMTSARERGQRVDEAISGSPHRKTRKGSRAS